MMELLIQVTSYKDMDRYAEFLRTFPIEGYVRGPGFTAAAEDVLTIFEHSPSREMRLCLPGKSGKTGHEKDMLAYLKASGLMAV